MEKQIYKDANAAADGFAQYLLSKHKSQDSLTVALSGGSTPKILFDLLASKYLNEIDWSKIHLYWGDERCVPPTDDDSNYKMTVEHLISKINIPEANIHRVLGENLPDDEADRYGALLNKNLQSINDIPAFDIIILGIGTDGHTASIFPHEIELMNSPSVCAVGINPDSGQKRVTLTGPVINNAKSICFLATGASKAEKLTEIFNKTGNYKTYPAAHVSPTHGELIWFMDESASIQ
ncbi:6-phosphogluconolactonase [Roseivirga misakiensis]|uniref:6-phosphogluconolactonase n=1 Tax=Roseivirga misakiensis TaxID=1563681 RepID=A0A1E5T016_9BACT|nr:6-phosphogluconolactonase [Roseivirga misakiensis]OEK04711.1 6-phosphogluconolactonase [Roseivirga misakiensis]